MISYDEFSWKKNKLYLGNKFTGYSIVQKFYASDTNFYWILFPDKVLSEDFYSKTRAKDNCVKYAARYMNNNTEEDQGIAL